MNILRIAILDGDVFYKEKFFTDYITNVEDFLVKEKLKWENDFDEAVKANPEDADDIFGYFEDDIAKHNNFNPALLYHSAFVSLISYFEATLFAMIEAIDAREKKVPGKKTIEIYRDALSEYGDLSHLSKQWDYIVGCYDIRNKIVHQMAKLKRSDVAKYEPIFKKFSSIEYGKDRTFRIIDNKILLRLNTDIAFYLRNAIRIIRLDIWNKIPK